MSAKIGDVKIPGRIDHRFAGKREPGTRGGSAIAEVEAVTGQFRDDPGAVHFPNPGGPPFCNV